MKKATKIFASLVAFTLVAASLGGCGKTKEKEVQKEADSFTYWTMLNGESAATISNYSEMLFYQEMEKATGVHMEFIHPIEGSTGNEAFIAMLNSGTRPDIIEYNWTNYTGGPRQAIDDEVIIALNDYIKEHAPNYYDYMEGEKGKAANYSYKLQATTDDGEYYGFNLLNVGEAKGFAGLIVRADLLKKWEMDVPETIDEWTKIFARAKAEGFEKPFTSTCDIISFKSPTMQGFNTAYDVGKQFYVEGEKVVFAPFESAFKDYVAQMAQWYKAGYIDSGFVTNASADIESNMTNGTSIATVGYVGSGIGKILPAAQAKDPSYDLVACPYPTSKKGELSEFSVTTQDATPMAITISSTCADYEKAIEWADYIYSDEGVALQVFGVEGETYTVEEKNGEKHYVYTDKITNYSEHGFNSITEALYHYMLPSNHPGYNQHEDYLDGYYQMQQQKDAIKIWNQSAEEALKHRLPTLGYTEEESREIIDIKEIAEPTLEVAICDIIFGKKSIDTYDEAVKEAKENGYDRWLEIQQEAYDRYRSKF